MSSTKPVGRPKLTAAEIEAMRQRLLACAKDAFIHEGYQSVSIRKITKAARCDPMSFYKYFDNKHELLRTLWAEYFVEVFTQCQAAADQHTSPLQAVRAYLKTYANYWYQHQSRYRLVFMIEDRLVDKKDRFYVDHESIAQQFEGLTQLLTAAIKKGEISSSNPKMSAQLLTVAISGLLHTHITISEYPWLDFEVMLDELITALVSPSIQGATDKDKTHR